MLRLLSFLLLLLLATVTARGQESSRELATKAFKAIDAKDFKTAAGLLERVLKANPRDANAHGNLGYVYAVLERYPEALDHCEKAIALDPKVANDHVNAAVYAARLSDFTKLKKYGESALAFKAPALKAENAKLIKELLQDLKPRVYTVTWTLDPKEAWGEGGKGMGPFYVALPSTDLPFQTSTYTVRGAKSHEAITRDGVRVLKFEADSPVELTATATVRFHDYRPKIKSEPAGPFPDDVRAYLGAGNRINPESAKIKAVAAKVKGGSPRVTVDNLIVWLKDNMKYKNPTTFDTVEEVLDRGHGDCGAYSAVFVAVCRANGIPAREAWGVVKADVRFAPKGHLSSHVWAEVYLTGLGWVPVEPQNPNGLGHMPTGYIRLLHFVADSHNWPDAVKQARGGSFGEAAKTPKYDEKPLVE